MASALQVEVVSHEGRLWHGVCTTVRVPLVDGALGILPRRQPLLASLAVGEALLEVTDAAPVTVKVEGGFVSVDSDFVTLVADHATLSE